MSNQTTHSDILIVGAGVSGLFAAWRLLKDDPSRNITIVEKLGRTGGRLQTTFVNINSPDGKPNVHDEEGGMRFVPEESGQMQHLWKLINDMKCAGYGLNPVDFVMGDSNNRYYIRGKSFTQKDVKDSNDGIWSTLFNLAPNEKGKNPTDILEEVVSGIMTQNNKDPKYRPKSPSEWIDFRNSFTYNDYDDKPVVINKWGFWSMLRRYGLTQECIEMLSHVLGFMGPFQDNVNAGEGLQILFDFPKPDKTQFKTLENGFEALPDALESEIKGMFGTFYLSTQIKSLSKQNGTYSAACVNVETGVSTTFTADKVILAIPKKPLKELAKASPGLLSDPVFHDAVNSVKDMELTKVGLYFEERWWHSNPGINLTNGPNFTDLPLGSVYTFSQFPADPDKDKAYNGPAALTQYTDYIRGNFWMELQNVGEMYEPIGVSQPEGSFPASRALVEEMMRQLKLLFGLKEDADIPQPVLSTYRVWGEGDFGYGYHQYKLNVNDRTDVYPNIYNPDKSQLYVCNESWSPEQGWVEGALIMSDYVMVKGFNMKPYAADGITGS